MYPIEYIEREPSGSMIQMAMSCTLVVHGETVMLDWKPGVRASISTMTCTGG